MVCGLMVPTLWAYFLKRNSSDAAFWSMLAGGSTTLLMKILHLELPLGLDQTLAGILVFALVFFLIHFLDTHSSVTAAILILEF
jgi:solute:Na+ symporter, SSS family